MDPLFWASLMERRSFCEAMVRGGICRICWMQIKKTRQNKCKFFWGCQGGCCISFHFGQGKGVKWFQFFILHLKRLEVLGGGLICIQGYATPLAHCKGSGSSTARQQRSLWSGQWSLWHQAAFCWVWQCMFQFTTDVNANVAEDQFFAWPAKLARLAGLAGLSGLAGLADLAELARLAS